MVQHLDETAGKSWHRHEPRVVDVVKRQSSHFCQGRDERVGVAPSDAIGQHLGLVRFELKVDLTGREVLGHFRNRGPYRSCRFGRAAVVVAFGPEPAQRSRLLAVLGDAQVESPDAPGHHAAPVDVARHPPESAARDPADDTLVRP